MRNLIFIASIAVIVVGAIAIFGNSSTPQQAAVSETLTSEEKQNLDLGLKIEDIAIGTGPEAQCGNELTVHYTGRLADGTKFDSSYDRNIPFKFRICLGKVIPGWDQGLLNMKEGGRRQLIIPPGLAYGELEVGEQIPSNSTLTFKVELLRVEEVEGTPVPE